MRKILMVIACLMVSPTLFGQSPRDIINAQFSKMPLWTNDLKFKYTGDSIINGLEIRYFYKCEDKCEGHFFFLTNVQEDLIFNMALIQALQEADTFYHYLSFEQYPSLFGCGNTDIDTFLSCRDSRAYSRNLDTGVTDDFYKNRKTSEWYQVYKVKAKVHCFQSNNQIYNRFFYPFTTHAVSHIQKVVYDKIIYRLPVIRPSVFTAKHLIIPNFQCVKFYH